MKTPCCPAQSFILAAHPTTRGIGWTLFESPLAPVDWAVVRSNDNAKCLERIEQLIERYAPEAIILEETALPGSGKLNRVQRLALAVAQLAANRGIEVCCYSRVAVRTCFASVGAQTRYEIAQAIATHVDAFRHRLPPLRKAWMSQDARLSIFDAAALALTHFSSVSEND